MATVIPSDIDSVLICQTSIVLLWSNYYFFLVLHGTYIYINFKKSAVVDGNSASASDPQVLFRLETFRSRSHASRTGN